MNTTGKTKGTVTNIAAELRARGLFEAEGGGKAEEFLAEKRTVYLGADPSADSLQVGNLVPIFLLKHLADAGHNIVYLVGGATGMIGDPRASGERSLLDAKTVAKNTKAIAGQLTQIFGKKKYKIVNNATWLNRVSLIDFLRDTAKHFTVNQLVKREIIKKRLDDNDPISFTEFSYSLLQGYDFWHLNKTMGVDMQIGGSDQWANIISGVELVRRREGKDAYALTNPIIIDKKTGKKFGKSEGNAVWLDPKKTTPYAFYQFWLNVPDDGVEEYLKIFTFLSLDEIALVMGQHVADPGKRSGQKRLAHEITSLIHGKNTADTSARVSEILFSGTPLREVAKADLAYIKKEVPTTKIAKNTPIVDALVASGLAESKGEARRLIEQKGVSLAGAQVTDVQKVIAVTDVVGGIAELRRGKKVALITLGA